ncbi:MAG: hypothetical protein U0326_34450 [Polyangiales bacterium]
MNRIVAEEEKALARVLANARVQRNSSRKDYDQELLELRDAGLARGAVEGSSGAARRDGAHAHGDAARGGHRR